METWSLAVVAALLLGYAVVSRRLERTALTPAIVFVVAGLLAGNEVLGWVDLEIDTGSVRLLAETTLTLVLFVDASRINVTALRHEIAFPARLLGIGLPLTIVVGAAIAAGLLDVLTAAEAVVLAIVLAPTDAALGQAVVSDERLPSRVRQGLNVESGLNDGICVPLLLIALGVAEADAGAISAHDAVQLVIEEIGWGVLGGVVAGIVGAALLRWAVSRRLVAEDWLQVIPMASAGLAYGIAVPPGGSGFIAAFVGGLVFGVLRRSAGAEVTYLSHAISQVLSGLTFTIFGAVILGPTLAIVGWRPVLYAVLSLTIVRMLPVALAMVGSHARWPTVTFSGWFGPRGLASIVFAVLVIEGANLPHVDVLIATIVVTVALSVLAHGLTARPLTDVYARWYAAHRRPLRMESVPVSEHPIRPTRSRAGEPTVNRTRDR